VNRTNPEVTINGLKNKKRALKGFQKRLGVFPKPSVPDNARFRT
jgi:hypothetical protein